MLGFPKDKQKFILSVTAALILFTLAGLVLPAATATTSAAGAGGVAYVDMSILMSQHPDWAPAQKQLQDLVEQLNKEYEAKSASLSEKDKQALSYQMQVQIATKENELLVAIRDKVAAVVKEVAESKGISAVVEKSLAIYGAEDITNDVGKKLSGK